MKLTKYEHACIVLEEQGKKLIIDPGGFTADFGPLDNIVAAVVTHVHGDHFNPEHLEAIVAANPDVKIFSTPEVTGQWQNPHITAVQDGQEQAVAPFNLRFYGELHNEIHSLVPRNQNTGVLVNGRFYYPGGSLTPPNTSVEVLALPACAPWLKVGEAIDFMQRVKPTTFCRTHDGLLGERGLATTDWWFGLASEKLGPTYRPLKPGESLEF